MICSLGALQRGANAEDLRGFFSYIWFGSRTGLCLHHVSCRVHSNIHSNRVIKQTYGLGHVQDCVCITFRAEFTATSIGKGIHLGLAL